MQDLFPEKLIRPRTEPVQGSTGPGSDYQPAMAPPPKITIEKSTVQVLVDFLATGLRGISPSSGG
jgi:hypothetical protein